MHRPTVGSYGGAFSYERGTPVATFLSFSETRRAQTEASSSSCSLLLSSLELSDTQVYEP